MRGSSYTGNVGQATNVGGGNGQGINTSGLYYQPPVQSPGTNPWQTTYPSNPMLQSKAQVGQGQGPDYLSILRLLGG